MATNANRQSWSPESAFAEFKKRFEELSSLGNDANEAETRLKIIDAILFDVLDWDKCDVEVERYCREEGYADYVFNTNKSICFVLEAKRAGVSFTVPQAKFEPRPVTFGLLEIESKAAASAMRQVIGYAASLGARYVALSNGSQWLLALTFVQSQALDERQVIILDSFTSIRDHFRQFWTCFSRNALSNNEICASLLESRKKPAPQRLSASIAGYPIASHRNQFLNELSYILNTVWDVLSRTEGTEQFLQACYVVPASNNHLIAFAQDMLKRRIAADRTAASADVSAAEPSDLKSQIIGYENEKPFVILGEVGHGKTTFLHYLRQVAAKSLFANYIQIEINFLDRPDSEAEVTDFIYKEIESQLLDRHGIDIYEDVIVRGALFSQIERFRKSYRYTTHSGDPSAASLEEKAFIQEHLKDRHEYFKVLVRHLKRGQKRSVAVFFDNLDRRVPPIQESAFLKASAIARDWECAVFICLRPATFYESLKRGLLDSLAPKTFTVGSPDLSLVLKRRFQFAEKLALGDVDTPILRQALQDKNVSFNLPRVAKIFGCCEFSARKDVSAIQMLAALSNGNIRYLLELAKRTITSGYLDTAKILTEIENVGSYFVPDFEAVKTLLYGDYDQYDPHYSTFANLFDTYHSDPKEHFLRILTLDYLNRFVDKDDDRRSVQHGDLLNYLESFYFDVATIQRHIKVLVESGCVDSGLGTSLDQGLTSDYRLTTKGSYHYHNLATEFQYVDAMTVDTPVIDPTYRKNIHDSYRIEERISRTDTFIAYLTQCADALVDTEGRAVCKTLLQVAAANAEKVKARVRMSRR